MDEKNIWIECVKLFWFLAENRHGNKGFFWLPWSEFFLEIILFKAQYTIELILDKILGWNDLDDGLSFFIVFVVSWVNRNHDEELIEK